MAFFRLQPELQAFRSCLRAIDYLLRLLPAFPSRLAPLFVGVLLRRTIDFRPEHVNMYFQLNMIDLFYA